MAVKNIKPIKQLPFTVAEKIAAGEVVDRPASVIKELIENALDAGAKNVSIVIKKGGKKIIKVTDDGWGIGKSDFKLLFARHATSKVYALEDLESITGYGFRGEALASIGAVAKVTIKSRRPATTGGYQISCLDSKISSIEPCGCPEGTTVEVNDLFSHFPARQKFLKSDGTEAQKIEQICEAFALAFPRVGFSLKIESKLKLKTSPESEPRRIASILGQDLYANLIPVDWKNPYLHLWGMVERPTSARTAAAVQSFFVNRRPVQSPIMKSALRQAYAARLQSWEKPSYCLFLEIAPELIDQNVHPQKTEVRFRETSMLYTAIFSALGKSLNSQSLPEYRTPSPSNRTGTGMTQPTLSLNQRQYHSPSSKQSAISVAKTINLIGVAFNTFIIVEDGDKLRFIDQHAAHERVWYNRLRSQSNTRKVQKLLLPQTVELSSAGKSYWLKNKKLFSQIGFLVRNTGKRCIRIEGVPAGVTAERVKDVIRRLFEGLVKDSLDSNTNAATDEIIASAACHLAIKAGDALENDELLALLNELDSITEKTCPHGRPYEWWISRAAIAEGFKRGGH